MAEVKEWNNCIEIYEESFIVTPAKRNILLGYIILILGIAVMVPCVRITLEGTGGNAPAAALFKLLLLCIALLFLFTGCNKIIHYKRCYIQFTDEGIRVQKSFGQEKQYSYTQISSVKMLGRKSRSIIRIFTSGTKAAEFESGDMHYWKAYNIIRNKNLPFECDYDLETNLEFVLIENAEKEEFCSVAVKNLNGMILEKQSLLKDICGQELSFACGLQKGEDENTLDFCAYVKKNGKLIAAENEGKEICPNIAVAILRPVFGGRKNSREIAEPLLCVVNYRDFFSENVNKFIDSLKNLKIKECDRELPLF